MMHPPNNHHIFQAYVKPHKIINDPVHGFIALPIELFKIIDTVIFQRLRDLKQLGAMYYVFPGATHKRFEHSLGTAYLAGQWLHLLKVNSITLHPEIKEQLTDRQIFLVQVAALCHDLGHGPFSHLFEDCFVKTLNLNFDHEVASVELLKIINKQIKENTNEEFLSETEISQVGDMILGKIPKGETKHYLYTIVHNDSSGIDVDKFDYLARDCKSSSLPIGYQFEKLLQFSQIRKEKDVYKICFDKKEAYNIYQLFHTRYSLHKEIYSHRVVMAIQLMIGDILKAADLYFKISDTLKQMQSEDCKIVEEAYIKYSTFTDSLLNEAFRVGSASNCVEELKEAKNLIERLYTRDLYNCICEIPLKQDIEKDDIENIISSLRNATEKQYPFLKCVKHSVNFGKGKHNPLVFVKFYEYSDTLTNLSMDSISGIINNHNSFQEIKIKIFSTKKLEELEKEEVISFISTWQRNNVSGSTEVMNVTPKKKVNNSTPRSKDVGSATKKLKF